MKKTINKLSVALALVSIISAMIGLLYIGSGSPFEVTNTYGDTVLLSGSGIYANNSLMKVGATKGTDAVTVLVAVVLILLSTVFAKKKSAAILQCGVLSILLYATSCLIFGVSFNRLFLLYVVQFALAFYTFLAALFHLLRERPFPDAIYGARLTGTGAFLLISGCSVLVWLTYIIPAATTGLPMENIEIYTTEPTYIIDLGVILPGTLLCGIGLLRKKAWAYTLASIPLTLLSGVAACVIGQTVFHTALGVVLSIEQVLGLLVSFVVLGAIAVVFNVGLLGKLR